MNSQERAPLNLKDQKYLQKKLHIYSTIKLELKIIERFVK